MTWLRGEVIERVDWAEGLCTLRALLVPGLAVPGLASVDFEPGQFVNVALSLETDDEVLRRSYSLASVPREPLEFYLVRVEGGALTPSLLELQVGGELYVDDKALGFFTIEHVPRCRYGLLVSTGTGLAPFLSMLRSER